ncbi:MAG: hypothetical protein ABS949_19860 [Solibacillus sp.]
MDEWSFGRINKGNGLYESIIKGFVVVIIALAINACAVPLAAFSLFGTPEGTSLFSVDYLIAAVIQLAPNIIVLQLIIALRKNKQPLVIAGWLVAIAEVILFFLLYQADLDLVMFMYIGLVVVGIGILLLVKAIRSI